MTRKKRRRLEASREAATEDTSEAEYEDVCITTLQFKNIYTKFLAISQVLM